jgi:hypothetical protein
MARDSCNHPLAAARTVQILRGHRATQLQAPVRGVHPGAATKHFHGAEKGAHATLEHLLDDARPAIGCIA